MKVVRKRSTNITTHSDIGGETTYNKI